MYFKERRKGMRSFLLCRSPWIPICHPLGPWWKEPKYSEFLPFFFVFFFKISSPAEIKVVVLVQLGEGQQLAPVPQGLCWLHFLWAGWDAACPSLGSRLRVFTKISLPKRRQKSYLSRCYIFTCFLLWSAEDFPLKGWRREDVRGWILPQCLRLWWD